MSRKVGKILGPSKAAVTRKQLGIEWANIRQNFPDKCLYVSSGDDQPSSLRDNLEQLGRGGTSETAFFTWLFGAIISRGLPLIGHLQMCGGRFLDALICDKL